MKNLKGKLNLKKTSMTVLNENESVNIKGGAEAILSIGCACSKRNHCDRTLTNTSKRTIDVA